MVIKILLAVGDTRMPNDKFLYEIQIIILCIIFGEAFESV